MITKALSVGDIFGYLSGGKDWKGSKREKPAEPIRGDKEKAGRFLQALCPFDLDNQKLRKSFYQRHCLHLMHSFSETEEVVRSLLAPIARGTEDLLLAGLGRDSLSIVTYYHPELSKGHVHIVALRYLLSDYRPYDSKFNADGPGPAAAAGAAGNNDSDPENELTRNHSLLERYTHLCNLKFSLSDKLDPERLRLIRPAKASFKPEMEPWTNLIEDYAWYLLKNCRLDGATFPVRLRRIGVEPVVAYDKEGNITEYGPPYDKKRELKDTLLVETPDGHQILFRGMLVRPDFNQDVYREEVDRRREIVRYFYQHGQHYYQRFIHIVQRRAERQKETYGPGGTLGQAVAADDFAWLRPPPAKEIVPAPMPPVSELGPPLPWYKKRIEVETKPKPTPAPLAKCDLPVPPAEEPADSVLKRRKAKHQLLGEVVPAALPVEKGASGGPDRATPPGSDAPAPADSDNFPGVSPGPDMGMS